MLGIWSNISSKGTKFILTSSVSSFRSINIFEKILIHYQKKLKVSFYEIFLPQHFPYISLCFLCIIGTTDALGSQRDIESQISHQNSLSTFFENLLIFSQFFWCYGKRRRCLLRWIQHLSMKYYSKCPAIFFTHFFSRILLYLWFRTYFEKITDGQVSISRCFRHE